MFSAFFSSPQMFFFNGNARLDIDTGKDFGIGNGAPSLIYSTGASLERRLVKRPNLQRNLPGTWERNEEKVCVPSHRNRTRYIHPTRIHPHRGYGWGMPAVPFTTCEGHRCQEARILRIRAKVSFVILCSVVLCLRGARFIKRWREDIQERDLAIEKGLEGLTWICQPNFE